MHSKKKLNCILIYSYNVQSVGLKKLVVYPLDLMHLFSFFGFGKNEMIYLFLVPSSLISVNGALKLFMSVVVSVVC